MNEYQFNARTSAVLRDLLMTEVRETARPKHHIWGRNKKFSTITVIIFTFVGIFSGAGVAVAVSAMIQPIQLPVSADGGATPTPQTSFSHNAAGQSYGSAGGYSPVLPDLVKVTGTSTSGQVLDGYVYSSQINEPAPTSPADAASSQKAWREKYPLGKTIPMYAVDGKTVVGTWVADQP
jgi:hypothetical protein